MTRKQDTPLHYPKRISILIMVLHYVVPFVQFFKAGRRDVLRNIFNFERINNLHTQFLGFTCERLK